MGKSAGGMPIILVQFAKVKIFRGILVIAPLSFCSFYFSVSIAMFVLNLVLGIDFSPQKRHPFRM